ncbi:hypothetical protein LTR37_006929 [Vermiconidia calcicola]|uniref:Uncharacterized protein n=1 Tax=Vermiconidia calcicola TaxID=1690605 RepID=A0ACC3NF60_9PEZI|nr:hypothetical protein LTR37_006929 [Vermiconidia calcicola]
MIAGQLKALLRNAAHSIHFWLPLEPTDNEYYDKSWVRANHDEGLEYFTHMSSYAAPWSQEEDWKDYKCIFDLEAASEELLRAVGILNRVMMLETMRFT